MTTKNLQYESGRSMVEMLGTLAIIGVLSVGGIMGYSYGMDKYRANQTMRDISLRIVDLITQASQKRTELSLAEWNNETTIYDFSNPAYSGDGLIKFDIGTTKKMPKSVCEMVFDGISNIAVQIDINAVHSGSNENCGEDNTMTLYFNGSGSVITDTGLTGQQCGGAVCGTCQKCENETCISVADYEQKCSTNDNKTGWCVANSCQADAACDCNEYYYCADTNEACEQANPSGTCVDAKSKFNEEVIDGTTYYISKSTISWWDAASACKALGKSLLNMSDLVKDWGSGTSPYAKTPLGEALYSKMGSKRVWTSTTACQAHYMALDNGGVGTYLRHASFYYAVCK